MVGLLLKRAGLGFFVLSHFGVGQKKEQRNSSNVLRLPSFETT